MMAKPKKEVKKTTLTLRLDPETAKILDEIKGKNNVAAASRMINIMIHDWRELHDNLYAAADSVDHYRDQYEMLFDDTKALKRSMDGLLSRIEKGKQSREWLKKTKH